MTSSTTTSSTTTSSTTADQITRKNREIYTDTDGTVWRSVVYDGLHEGWELINLGGAASLEHAARRAGLGAGHRVLELGCGQGAACRWLASRRGCRVDGVELNEGQVRAARRRLEDLPSEVAARIRIAQGDAATPPARLFDSDDVDTKGYEAVVSFDVFMLLPDVPAVLATAFDALAPGGRLVATTLVAGPRADDEIRRFAWEVDGMLDLPPIAAYTDRLRAAGFDDVVLEDWTDAAIAASERMDQALMQQRAELEDAVGAEHWLGWKQVGDLYLDAFRAGRLGYLLLVARRPVRDCSPTLRPTPTRSTR